MPKIRVKLATNIVTTPVSTLSSTTPRIFHIFAPGQRPVLKTVHQHVTRQRQRQCWYLVTVVKHLCHFDWKDFQHRNLVRPEAGNCEKSVDSWDYSSETALNRPTKKCITNYSVTNKQSWYRRSGHRTTMRLWHLMWHWSDTIESSIDRWFKYSAEKI